MDFFTKTKRKRVLFTTITKEHISIINQIPGRKIDPRNVFTIDECLLLANSESYLSGRYQPAIGLRFLKENIPSIDILEFPDWKTYQNALKDDYDVVGISFYTTNYDIAVKMVNVAREAGVQEVWAGNYGAMTPGVSDNFDRVFIGLSEKEIRFIVEGSILDDLKHPIITTPFRVLFKGNDAGYLFTTRSCKFKCEFCCSNIFSKSTDQIKLEEIERVLDVYQEMGVRYINIGDETFLQNRGHAKEVINLMHNREMNWFCTSRADLLLNNVSELTEKGFNSVYIGIESMNEKNLANQNKGESIQKILSVLNEFNVNGVSASGTYILGLPQDTLSSIKEDLEKLNNLSLFITIFLIFTPYPGLPVYNQLKKTNQLITNNWKYYDGLNPVFKHPNMSTDELRSIFQYAIKNVYKSNNFNKRKVIRRLNQLEEDMIWNKTNTGVV